MQLQLVELEWADLRPEESSPPARAGLALVGGALPPTNLLAAARLALDAGMPRLWHVPFGFGAEGRLVGSGGFKGPPCAGRVEVGYGVAPSAQGRGYATAAVFLLCERAFGETDVAEVVAETAVGNTASQRVLVKAGFLKLGSRDSSEDGHVFCWRRTR